DSRSIAARVSAHGSNKATAIKVFDAPSGQPYYQGHSEPPTISPLWIKIAGHDQDLYGIVRRSGKRFELSGAPTWNGFALPSDDFEISPDGLSVVFSAPEKKGPAAQNTLQVLSQSNPV